MDASLRRSAGGVTFDFLGNGDGLEVADSETDNAEELLFVVVRVRASAATFGLRTTFFAGIRLAFSALSGIRLFIAFTLSFAIFFCPGFFTRTSFRGAATAGGAILDLALAGIVLVADNFGDRRPIIRVDGWIDVRGMLRVFTGRHVFMTGLEALVLTGFILDIDVASSCIRLLRSAPIAELSVCMTCRRIH